MCLCFSRAYPISMIREFIKKHYHGLKQEFRFRGEEPVRLEILSDAVFALANKHEQNPKENSRNNEVRIKRLVDLLDPCYLSKIFFLDKSNKLFGCRVNLI